MRENIFLKIEKLCAKSTCNVLVIVITGVYIGIIKLKILLREFSLISVELGSRSISKCDPVRCSLAMPGLPSTRING